MNANNCFTTPIALFIYNRPQKAKTVLNRISTAEPEKLLIVADGPAPGDEADRRRCRRTRELVEKNINWDCEVKKNYANSNLGLRQRFATGLEWIFSNNERAIILEDDCVPVESFFYFCNRMLEEYEDDERIMDISGTNYLGTWKDDQQDFHFSMYGGIWGWATWRRTWEWYDPDMELWGDEEVRNRIADYIADNDQFGYLKYIYEKVYNNRLETWDYQWGFARHRNSALSVVPSRNLVTNIGFGADATNTTESDSESEWSNLPAKNIEFPIQTNDFVAVDREYDRRFHKMRPVSHRNAALRFGRRLYERYLS